MNLRANIQDLRSAIDRMFLEYPELADDEILRADMFEGETELHAVFSEIVDTAMDAATMAEALKLRMTDLHERKSRFERKEEALRGLIADLMESAGFSRIMLPEATLSIRKIAPAPFVIDETALPENCIRIKRVPDMQAIKEQINQGISVAGTAMSIGKTSLTIRTK